MLFKVRRSAIITLVVVASMFAMFATTQTHVNAVTDNSITVQTIPGPTLAERFSSRAEGSWPWYLVRASGVVAAISLVILILSGVGQVTGFAYRFLEPLTAWATHRALGIAFTVSVVIHMGGLLFDHFVPFNIWQLLIPWLSDYNQVTIFGFNVGSLYVALGVLAFYLTIIVVASSLLWVEKKPKLWKWLHLLSYLVIAFVFVHALFLGTDLENGFLRWVWIALGLAIAWSIVHRLWRAKTI